MSDILLRTLGFTCNYTFLMLGCAAVLHSRIRPDFVAAISAVVVFSALQCAYAERIPLAYTPVINLSVAFLIAAVFFTDPWAERIGAVCQVCSLGIIADSVVWTLGAALMEVPVRRVMESMRTQLSYLPLNVLDLSLCALLVTVWVWIRRHLMAQLMSNPRGPNRAYLSVQTLALVLFLEEILVGMPAYPFEAPFRIAFVLIGASALCLLWTFGALLHAEAKQTAANSALDTRVRIRRSYIEQLESYAHSMESVRTQACNAVQALKEYIRTQDDTGLEAYISNFSVQIKHQEPAPYSDSLAVSSVLAQKEALCASNDIQLRVRTRMDFLILNEFEACLVLFNLLDNAIHATEHLVPEDRWISLHIAQQGGMRALICTNPFDPEKARHRNPLKHGAGLRIVRAVCSTYDGTLQIEKKADQFSVRIAFFLSQGAKKVALEEDASSREAVSS